MGGLCGLGVLLVILVGEGGESSLTAFADGSESTAPSSPFEVELTTMMGDEGGWVLGSVDVDVELEMGRGGTGGVFVDEEGRKRALVLGAETTRLNHLVAADPPDLNGEFSLSCGESGGNNLSRCFVLFGVRGDD